MLWLSPMCEQQSAEGGHTQSGRASSGSEWPWRRLWSNKALGTYDWTTESSLGWKLVLQPRSCVTETIGKDGAVVGTDPGILKWD